ncbi:TetR/AcrR family transcriptional regulator [Rhizobium sp. P38BS-XIX]|nr:TetR/AcrR family transcriptional regulator [Rhizobium sp. P38BS-XIX]
MGDETKSDPHVRRKRNAAVTRDEILSSARRLFAAHGYTGVGVREIAAGAGVTAMLVNRYFGSKEELFAEALSAAHAEPVILSRENLESDDFPRAFAQALVGITEAGGNPLEGISMMIRSASSERAAELAKSVIEKNPLKTLTSALDGNLAPQRAALMLSLVSGFQMLRQTIGITALSDAKPEDLVELLTPILRMLLAPEKS